MEASSLAKDPTVFCMSVTPFDETGGFDESAYRQHLERLVGSGVGIYFASPGSGEGHSLTNAELEHVYRVGVETCKGKVPICANIPEARTAQGLLEKARLAIRAGVDVVQIYTVDPGHGMRPTEAEQEAFYREVLDQIDYPVGLSVNMLAGGYRTPIGVLKRLCADYRQVQFVNVLQPPTAYLSALMDAIGPRIPFYCGIHMMPEALTLGVAGCLAAQPNVVPFLVRSIGHHLMRGNIEQCGSAYRQIFRLHAAVEHLGARWIKAAMAILDLPGHGGGRMRPPYLPLDPEETRKLGTALHAMGLMGSERRAQAEIIG